MPDSQLQTLPNGQKPMVIEPNWKTPEHIEVKPVYTKEDLEGMEHLNYASGIASLSTWPVQRYVRYASLDNPSVCRFLYR